MAAGRVAFTADLISNATTKSLKCKLFFISVKRFAQPAREGVGAYKTFTTFHSHPAAAYDIWSGMKLLLAPKFCGERTGA
jgi:hypothetical protein